MALIRGAGQLAGQILESVAIKLRFTEPATSDDGLSLDRKKLALRTAAVFAVSALAVFIPVHLLGRAYQTFFFNRVIVPLCTQNPYPKLSRVVEFAFFLPTPTI
jgi:hypothetical protein